MKDESIDDKEIEHALENEIVEDEMDKLIELKANKIGYSILGFGLIAGLVAVAFGTSAVALLNLIFFSAWVGSFIEGLMQIRYYRKGVR